MRLLQMEGLGIIGRRASQQSQRLPFTHSFRLYPGQAAPFEAGSITITNAMEWRSSFLTFPLRNENNNLWRKKSPHIFVGEDFLHVVAKLTFSDSRMVDVIIKVSIWSSEVLLPSPGPPDEFLLIAQRSRVIEVIMEFPELGKHCGFKECNLLDFLPVKCGWCRGHFCKDHWAFEAHHCPDAQQQNRGSQVPVCPLCDGPVPTPKGRSADEFVSAHIDRDCKADEDLKRRQRVFTKRCSVPKCRQKLVVKVDCSSCRRTFCLTHRHPQVLDWRLERRPKLN